MRQLLGRGWLLTLAVLVAATVVPLAIAGSAPVLSFSVDGSTFFGTVAKNSTTTRTWTFTNTGGSATAALTVSLTGAAAFTISSDTCSATSLGPKKSCKVGVSYTPTTDGADDHSTLTVTAKKPVIHVPFFLNGATPDPYPQSRVDCTALGGTFSTDPATNATTASGTFLWSCNNGPSQGFSNVFSDQCFTDAGGAGALDFTANAPWGSSCYRY